MTLARQVVVPGMIEEYQAFAALVRSLSADEWQRSSRCEGWRVADVAAHVAGTLTDVVNLRLDGLGSPEVTDRQVAERRGRTPAELADEVELGAKLAGEMAGGFDDAAWEQPAPAGVQGTLGFGLEALWYDTYVHADDIRHAVGQPTVPGDGLRASLSHIAALLTDRGWPPATLALDGVDELHVSGGGTRISGDPMSFVLAATGRGDPAALGLDETVNIYRD